MMWGTTAVFAALAFPLACYGIDFSADTNFEIIIHCGDTPVVLQDPGFSQVKSPDELQKLIEKKMQEALKSPACKELLENPEESIEGKEACPVTSDGSSTATPTTKTTTPEQTPGSDIYKIQSYKHSTHFIGGGPFPRLSIEPKWFRITSSALQGTVETVSFELLPESAGNAAFLYHIPDATVLRFESVNEENINGSIFWQIQNKFFNGTYAYESYDKPGYFIHCCGEKNRLEIKAESLEDKDFKEFASFHQIAETDNAVTQIQRSEGKTTLEQNITATIQDVGGNTGSCYFNVSTNHHTCFGAIIHPRRNCSDVSVRIDRNPINNSTEDGNWVRLDLMRKSSSVFIRKVNVEESPNPCTVKVFYHEGETETHSQGERYVQARNTKMVWLNVTSGCRYEIGGCKDLQ